LEIHINVDDILLRYGSGITILISTIIKNNRCW